MASRGFLRVLQRALTVLLFKLARLVFTGVQSVYWRLNGTAQQVRDAHLPQNYERSAHVLDVILFHKFCELQNTFFEDFICTHNRFENPQFIVDNDHVSLLLVDEQNAVFCEARETGMELWRSRYNAFIRLAQMEFCKRLIVVPLSTFHRLAELIGDPSKLIILFNTSRCGSTLVTRIMESTGRCVASSEPNCPNLISAMYRQDGDTPQLRQLARDVIRWECRPYSSFKRPPLAYLLKVTSPCAMAIPLFRELYPESRLLFMYRDYIGMAKSLFRVSYQLPSLCLVYTLGRISGTVTEMVADSAGFCGKDFNVRTEDGMTFGVFVSAMTMACYLDLRRRGFDMAAVRYEDFVARPVDCCRRLMEYCRLPVELADPGIDGLKDDSQQNSLLSKSSVGRLPEPTLTPKSKTSLNKLLGKHGLPLIGEECLVEGTITDAWKLEQ